MLSPSSPTTRKLIRVLLVQDQAIVRESLRLLIESWSGFSVVGEASNRNDVPSIAARERPDVVLLDIHWAREGGLEFLSRLLSATQAKAILLTAMDEPEVHDRAISLGAAGLVLRERGSDDLRDAISRVYKGEIWLDPKLILGVINRMRAREIQDPASSASILSPLVRREREVALLAGGGLSNKEIAGRLLVSESTVRHDLTSIFKKLQVSNRFELIIFLHRHELV